MIHISELSWDRIGTPEAVVKPGDEVRCKILRIDPAKSRISLSLKARHSSACRSLLQTAAVAHGGCEMLKKLPSPLSDLTAFL